MVCCGYGFVQCRQEAYFEVYDFSECKATPCCEMHVAAVVQNIGCPCMVKYLVKTTAYVGDLVDRCPNRKMRPLRAR